MGERAQSGKLGMDELTGGTFSITNGGVFGSMLSTPILNPPQSAIMGMHSIQQRAVVIDGEIVARPMMYLALTYDHRIVDGNGNRVREVDGETLNSEIKSGLIKPVKSGSLASTSSFSTVKSPKT